MLFYLNGIAYITMSKRILLSGLISIFFVAGCADRPESIVSSYISHERYIEGSCVKLAAQMIDARANLAKFSKMQNSKATGDAWGVYFILIPVSKLTGDSKADVAKYKGIVEAIETAQIKNKCKES